MSIHKAVDDSSVTAGQTVVFTITIRNTGNTDIYGITVYDEMLNVNVGYSMLAAGASESFTENYQTDSSDVPGFTNTAVVEGYAMQEIPVRMKTVLK